MNALFSLLLVVLLIPLFTPLSVQSRDEKTFEATPKERVKAPVAAVVRKQPKIYIRDSAQEWFMLRDQPACAGGMASPGYMELATIIYQDKKRISDEQYLKCWKYLGKKVVEGALKKAKRGEEVKKIMDALECFEANTTAEVAIECVSLLCKFAPVAPCALLEGGKFLEACLNVAVVDVAQAIIPNTMDRLADNWEGVDCSKTDNRQSCLLCCRAQWGAHGDGDKFLKCNDGCAEKKQLVK